MNSSTRGNRELADLVDRYLADTLDEAGFDALQAWLLRDEAARRYFTLYGQMHTDLSVEARAKRAGDRAIAATAGKLHVNPHSTQPEPTSLFRSWRRLAAVAAIVVLAVSLTWWAARRGVAGRNAAIDVAWLANAQDCQWVAGSGPEGGLAGNRIVKLERGLAEIHFRSGARIVLEGPASLQLLSDNSARLLSGRLTARVPEPARGFQVFAPQGRVVDLGTEFGVAVSPDGSADVIVFKGKVEAYSAGTSNATSMGESRTARIDGGAVMIDPEEHRPVAAGFTREIEPAQNIVPRTLKLDFRRPSPDTLKDRGGVRTGLDARLPGTGMALLENDPHLHVDTTGGLLEVTTTRSDINTQYRLAEGEYPGARLSRLGFTGGEDFEVTAVLRNIPSLAAVGQFGLYAGTRSDKVIRGGLISRRIPDQYRQFLVNNDGGVDRDSMYVGVLPTGSDVRLALRRISGKYSMSVESLSSGAVSTLSIQNQQFMDGAKDLYVGLFAANTGSEEQSQILVTEFAVTVWAKSPLRRGAEAHP